MARSRLVMGLDMGNFCIGIAGINFYSFFTVQASCLKSWRSDVDPMSQLAIPIEKGA